MVNRSKVALCISLCKSMPSSLCCKSRMSDFKLYSHVSFVDRFFTKFLFSGEKMFYKCVYTIVMVLFEGKN